VLKKVKTIVIDIILHAGQEAIDTCARRFRVVRAGRRFGKTKYAIYWLIKRAAKPGTTNWLVAPTYKQAKEISWRTLLTLIPPDLVKSKNATDLVVELKNGSIICLKGAENENNLRGPGLWSVVMEEAAYIKASIWSDIIRPMLADQQGHALFISTPRGKNWFHQLYEMALSGEHKDWAAFYFTIHDNPHISKEEIVSIRNSPECSEITWRQEYLAEIASKVGQVYSEFNEGRNAFIHGEAFAGSEKWLCVRGMDYGTEAEAACVWIHVDQNTGQVVVLKEHVQSGWAIPQHAEVIQLNSHGLMVSDTVLDCSAFRQDPTSMSSIAREFAKLGIRCLPSEKKLDVSIDVMKRFLQGDKAGPWLHISSGCPKILKALGEWEWGQHEPDVLAALRYGIFLIYRKNLSKFTDLARNTIHEHQPGTQVRIGLDGQRHLRRPARTDLRWDYDYGVPV
jgi:hypothetical protein